MHHFSVACGTGVDARVMAETASEQKRRWGIGAYMATAVRVLPEIRSHDFVITVDGVEFEAKAAMILVANCGEVIPPVAVALRAARRALQRGVGASQRAGGDLGSQRRGHHEPARQQREARSTERSRDIDQSPAYQNHVAPSDTTTAT